MKFPVRHRDTLRLVRPREMRQTPHERAENKRFKERWQYGQRRWDICSGVPDPEHHSYPGSWWPMLEEHLIYRTGGPDR